MNNLKLNTLTFLLTICCIWQMSASEYFYYYKGEKIFLELNTEYIFVSGVNRSSVQSVNSSTFRNERSIDIFEDQTFRTVRKPEGVAHRSATKYCREIALVDNLSEESYLEEIEELRKQYKDLNFAPYFKNEADEKIGISEGLYIKLKNTNNYNTLLSVVEEYDLIMVGQNKFMPMWYILEISPSTPHDAMQMTNILHEAGLFACIEPTFLFSANISNGIISNSSSVSQMDTYYPSQWYLNNTGQDGGTAGIDINIEDAWKTTRGNGINVAVFDNGIGEHPDLDANIVGDGYNVKAGSAPSEVLGAHGTPCAGIIGAERDNDLGISGVAPECGLISVSRSGSRFHLLADGINWSWQNGADIISNSWSHNALRSCMIDDAINNALTKGRSGLGTIVVFAAGNNNYSEVNYPGSSNSLILCVGGIDRCGFRSGNATKIQTCDSWGRGNASNYGSFLDVVAGGTSILTTDNTSKYLEGFGYNPPEDADIMDHPDLNYTYFLGTSAACPIVAGVAALVLSANPNLTVRQVNDIIEQSAQKIREGSSEDECNKGDGENQSNGDDCSYNFQYLPNRPNGKWNEQVGYGLVDANEAVKLAKDYKCVADVQIPSNKNGNTLEVRYSSSEEIITTSDNLQSDVDVIINEGEAVYMRSNHIKLNAGFKVENGACLNATIDPCE